ncbi:MAG: class A beta-lactamase [Mycobacterium sp.]
MAELARRHFLTAGLSISALALIGSRPAWAQPAPSIQADLAELESRHDALIGVYAVDLQSGRVIAHRETERFAMCSTFKAYLAARILQKAERGELSLTDTVTVRAADLLPNSPVTETRVDQPVTLGELSAAAVQVSDNAAANYLLEIIGGPAALTEFARSIGDYDSRLDRWEPELNAAVPGDPRDTSTPQALGSGILQLLDGNALTDSARTQLLDWMFTNTTSSLRPGLPPGWTLADKTGGGGYGSTNDVGVAVGPDGRKVLLAVMVRSAGDDPDADGFRPVMPEIAALLMPALSG